MINSECLFIFEKYKIADRRQPKDRNRERNAGTMDSEETGTVNLVRAAPTHLVEPPDDRNIRANEAVSISPEEKNGVG